MDLCRLCLKTGKIMCSFDEVFVYQYNLLTNLNVSLLDKMPHFSCNTCWDTVKDFIVFREKSIKSEEALQAIILSTNSSNIKKENVESQCGSEFLVDDDDNDIKEEENYIPIESEPLVQFPNEEDDCNIDDLKNEIKVEGYTIIESKPIKNETSLLEYDYNITKTKEALKPKKISSQNNRLKKKITEKISVPEKLQSKLDDDKWFCGICPNIFEKEFDVKRHLDIHKDDRQCALCNLKMNSTSQLLAHRLKHVPSKQFRCHICAKRFRTCLPLEHHYRNMHIEGDDPKLSCEICNSSFNTPKRLNYHKRQVHSNIRFFCDVCSKGFTSKGYLKSHIKHHSEIKSYVCDVCGFSCNYSGGLKNHKIWRHSQNKINCKNCSRPFSNQLDYDRHTCRARLKVCSICGLQLARRANLARHMAIHSDVYPYECKRCPAKYKTKTGLLAHNNKHDGNRTKHCEYCPAKFYTAAVLIKHRRTHTGEKPAACKVCKKAFTGKDSLKLHMKDHYQNSVTLLDGMPQFSCESCLHNVKKFIQFREKSIESEATLRELFVTGIKSENIEIELQNETESKIQDENLNFPLKYEIKCEKEDDAHSILDNFDLSFGEYDGDFRSIIKDDDVKPKKIRKKKTKKKVRMPEPKQNIVDGDKWLCGICPKVFEDQSEVHKHLDIHKDRQDRQCELCKETMNSISQLLAHRLRHVPSKHLNCHICDKRFKSCLYLEHHYRDMHIEEDDNKLFCPICQSSFGTPKKLKGHMSQVHSGNRFVCDICSKSFGSKGCMKSHIKHHSKMKSYVCDLCGYSCNYSGGLKDHKIRRHSQKKVYCKNCSRAFSSQLDYDRHKCKAKHRVCPICGIQLSGSSRLTRHMISHSDVYKYECDRCPAKYKSKTALIAHNDRHDGNRTKHCEYCPAKFYTAAVLIKHRRTHTGEKPAACKVCKKAFTGKYP